MKFFLKTVLLNRFCAPSRFALITGTFAASSDPENHIRAERKTPSWMTGFPEFLRKVGYFTVRLIPRSGCVALAMVEDGDSSVVGVEWGECSVP
jgi:hypothetical protein